MKSCLVIANPAAGRRKHYTHTVVVELRKQGMAVELYETTGPGDAIRELQARAQLPPLVIAAGGDGTVNEVLNGLAGRDVTLGLIPAGTTNVLAIELGYPSSAAAVAGVLARGNERRVHFASANDRRFGMMVGIGYDAWVVAGVKPETKKKLGKLAYVISMFAQLRAVGSRRYRVLCDGVPHEACSAIISNGRHYAGSYLLAHDADLSVPALDAVLISPVSRLRFFGMLLLLPLGIAAKMPFVRIVRAREIHVSCDVSDDPVQADGDTIGKLPLVIRSEAQSSRVVAP